MSNKKLSLIEAVFININIMLGTGTFVNTAVVAHHVGALGAFLYLGAGCLMLPLAFCFAALARALPGSSFYAFGNVLGGYWGFISTWVYFFGKLASSSLSIHVFANFLQKTVPALTCIPILQLDYMLIAFFISLNLLDIKTGSRIQYLFLTAKLLPVLFVITLGLHYVDLINLQPAHLLFEGIPITLPLMLFCFLGFEATCSLSRVIDQPEVNVPRVVITSFCTVLTLIFLYQMIFYLSMGSALGQAASYVEIFPLLLSKVWAAGAAAAGPVFSTTIGIAALGGAYGILYSNPWNLYVLAEHDALPYSDKLRSVNRYAIPYVCVLAEGVLCCAYIMWLKGSQIPMQYTATLCCIITYTISIFGLIKLQRSLLSFAGLATCLIMLFLSLQGFVYTSLVPFIVITGIAALGSITYFFQKSHA